MRRVLVCVLCACVCTLGLAGVASGSPHAKLPQVVAHWPNSPVRHLRSARGDNGSPAFSANVRGGVAFAGNTLLTCPENTARSRHVKRPPHTLVRSADSQACVGANNNDHNMRYVNVDPSDKHFDSSSATLTVPAGASVEKAFLYYGADLAEGVNRPTVNPPSFGAPGNRPRLHRSASGLPASWKYPLANRPSAPRLGFLHHGRRHSTSARNGVWKGIASWYNQPGQDPGFAYQVRADVTNEVSAAVSATKRRAHRGADKQLTVTVADVQAGKGYNRHGGWNLLVVWRSPTASWRNITIFDGFEFVQVEGGEQLVVGPLNFTGFSTPPSGKVDAHVTTWTYEGDRDIVGDYMALGQPSTTCGAQTHLTDALHPVGNFFNSAISRHGVDNGDRAPDYSNQMGFDLATVDVPEKTIPNAATGASVCLGTDGDTYFFGGIVFDTLIQAPNLEIAKVADVSQAGPGDTVTYTTTVKNPSRDADDPLGPTAPATNLVVTDPLPSGLAFGGFVVGSPPCDFSGATLAITCDVGTLNPGQEFTYSFTATVKASAQGPAPNPVVNIGCFTANAPPIPGLFTGCDNATITVPPTPPQPVPADLGVVKTVSANVVAPGDTVTWKIVGTNYGPATSTGFTLADQLPAGVSFVSATAESPLTCTTPPVGATGAVTCTAPSVPPKPAAGSSLTLTIVATVPASTANGTLLLNVATVRGDQNEPAPDPHSNRDETLTSVVVPDQPIPPSPNPLPPSPSGPPAPPVPQPPEPPTPDVLSARLSLQKHAMPSLVTRGATVTFSLRVKNVTEVSALKVRVCDTLPHGLTVASSPGFSVHGSTLCAAIGTLKALATKAVSFSARITTPGPSILTNHATASAGNAGPVHARARITVAAPPPAVTG